MPCLIVQIIGEGDRLMWEMTHTFIKPVSKPVEDGARHARGGNPQGVAPHVRLIVDVVLKNVNLRRKRKGCTFTSKFDQNATGGSNNTHTHMNCKRPSTKELSVMTSCYSKKCHI